MRVKSLRLSRMACLVAAALALSTGGCIWIAAGAAAGGAAAVTYAYNQGRVASAFPATYENTYAATRTALAELKMPILEESQEKGTIKSQTADGETVRIELLSETSKIQADGPVTRVCVRVSAFGDEAVSARVLDQVSAHLAPPKALSPAWNGVAPPAPPTPPPTTGEPPLLPAAPVKLPAPSSVVTTPPPPGPAPSGTPSPSSRP